MEQRTSKSTLNVGNMEADKVQATPEHQDKATTIYLEILPSILPIPEEERKCTPSFPCVVSILR
jgi:hypothetical protein